MGLSRNRSLDHSEEFSRRQREKLKNSSLLKDFDSDDADQYSYEMALKKRSITSMMTAALKEDQGKDAIKGIKWRRRRIEEEE